MQYQQQEEVNDDDEHHHKDKRLRIMRDQDEDYRVSLEMNIHLKPPVEANNGRGGGKIIQLRIAFPSGYAMPWKFCYGSQKVSDIEHVVRYHMSLPPATKGVRCGIRNTETFPKVQWMDPNTALSGYALEDNQMVLISIYELG